MKKCILIAVQAKHAVNILTYDQMKECYLKILELRKSCPGCEFPIDVYMYVTRLKINIKSGDNNKLARDGNGIYYGCPTTNGWETILNGKIVSKWTLTRVSKLYSFNYDTFWGINEHFLRPLNELLEQSCLTEKELSDYCNDKDLFAWHIDNLVIFDKPMELKKFFKLNIDDFNCSRDCYVSDISCCHCLDLVIKKAPQSWQYAWLEE